jgi:hypothetical protein
VSREQQKRIRAAAKEVTEAEMWARIYTRHLEGFLARVARAKAALRAAQVPA